MAMAERRRSILLSALVLAMLMANASATLFNKGGWKGGLKGKLTGGFHGGFKGGLKSGLKCKLFPWKCPRPIFVPVRHPPTVVIIRRPPPPPPVADFCPALPPRFLTSQTCKYADGTLCPDCWGKCCLRDGNCAAPECNRSDQVCSVNQFGYWSASSSSCIGNINRVCGCANCGSSCPAPVQRGFGSCVPVNSQCIFRSRYCLGTVQCSNPAVCGPWQGATCIFYRDDNTYRVCECGSRPPPNRFPDAPTNQPPPRSPRPLQPSLPRSPRNPRSPQPPRTPWQPRSPRSPRPPQSPRYPRNPDAPNELEPPSPRSPRSPRNPRSPPSRPDRPRSPRRPRSPSPRVPDSPTGFLPPPPTTCPKPDIPISDQCFYANRTRCSRCLGKCCLLDGHCASPQCNGYHSRPNDFCEWNPNAGAYTDSNCLGDKNLSCPGPLYSSHCPAAIKASSGVCVPINPDCGRMMWGDKYCLGYVSCPNGGCGDWQGAPCIYDGYDKLDKLLGQTRCTADFKVCSCPTRVPFYYRK